MREIKFRQENPNGGWHYWGCFDGTFVAPLQVGDKSYQFTGLHDRSGREIYEGDIFQCRSGDNKADMQGEIYFREGSFNMKYGYQTPRDDQRKDYFLSSEIGNDGAARIEVIGVTPSPPAQNH